MAELTTPRTYWSEPASTLVAALASSMQGLSTDDAARRRQVVGPNTLREERSQGVLGLLANQVKSPLVLVLVFAAAVSTMVGEYTDAGIVLAVVLGSALLGFAQEYRANGAVARLKSQIAVQCRVWRDGEVRRVPAADVVPGDVVQLSAGSLIPADGVVLVSDDLFVNQAVLTGESLPVEKVPGTMPGDAALAERTNCVFAGTSVRSGSATVLIMTTGAATHFGQIAGRLRLRPPQTAFERGLQAFGYLLTRVMLVMVLAVLAANLILAKPPIDSLLFALALAVGLTPELLPAVVSITLARGAQKMAKRGVIVRRLNSIENLGSMDVLCTDKTGTLTRGTVELDAALDVEGNASLEVLRTSAMNASLQAGLENPLDTAVVDAARAAGAFDATARKVEEIPYDFTRKRLSVVCEAATGERTLITKGALDNVLACCSHVRSNEGLLALDAGLRERIDARFRTWSGRGYRVLGVASRIVPAQSVYTTSDETNLALLGFLLFMDPPKPDARQTIADLASRGVHLKVITGDNRNVAQYVAQAVNLTVDGVLTGRELNDMRDEALWHAAASTTVFAEVDPNQKERIIRALQMTGHVVGYMGDGINDAPALHAADVGLSVDTAVDVAKDAADFVLLRADLDILREGIDEGRRTFANTLKYILTTVSANFGNMLSMAAASLMLPFLPLLAPQILLNNFLSDIPAAGIASDRVDPEWLAEPRRWNATFIRNYMVLFGLVSSLFDFLTFGVLLYVYRAAPSEFRTGWFIESLLTELVIALVVRTRRLSIRSRPSPFLLWTTILLVVVTFAVPYLPGASVFGFVPLPLSLLGILAGLIVLYVVSVELAKFYFYSTRVGLERAADRAVGAR